MGITLFISFGSFLHLRLHHTSSFVCIQEAPRKIFRLIYILHMHLFLSTIEKLSSLVFFIVFGTSCVLHIIIIKYDWSESFRMLPSFIDHPYPCVVHGRCVEHYCSRYFFLLLMPEFTLKLPRRYSTYMKLGCIYKMRSKNLAIATCAKNIKIETKGDEMK